MQRKTVKIEGIGEIDESIAKYIEYLNKFGYKTIFSCSGLACDHNNEVKEGYIYFMCSEDKVSEIEKISKKLNIHTKKFLRQYFTEERRIIVSFNNLNLSDEERLKIWDKFCNTLLNEDVS
jgi:hypothetical protein